jgi:hypothetical protein
LHANLPRAQVAIVDSHEEMRRTTKQWDLIVVDNPVWPQEHFELFPAVLDRLSDDAVLDLFVITNPNPATRRLYPDLFRRSTCAGGVSSTERSVPKSSRWTS